MHALIVISHAGRPASRCISAWNGRLSSRVKPGRAVRKNRASLAFIILIVSIGALLTASILASWSSTGDNTDVYWINASPFLMVKFNILIDSMYKWLDLRYYTGGGCCTYRYSQGNGPMRKLNLISSELNLKKCMLEYHCCEVDWPIPIHLWRFNRFTGWLL